MAGKLTDAKIKGFKPPAAGQIEHSDSDVPGLRVRIGTSGTKTFILRKRVAGKISNITLGRYVDGRFGLADARRMARTRISDIEAGRVPAKAAKPTVAAMTIGALMPAYLADRAQRRSIAEITRIANAYIVPGLGERVVDVVTRGDVTRFIAGIADRAPAMARAVHAQLSAFYSWAMEEFDTLDNNPCQKARRPAKGEARKRVLSDHELAALWAVAGEESPPWGPGYRLLILTGARLEEVFQARWSEFDLERGEWLLPDASAKNGQEVILPLSDAALSVLAGMERDSESPFLFPTRTKAHKADRGPSGYSKAQTRMRALVDARLRRRPQGKAEWWTAHDIRRTVATGLQRLGVAYEVNEAILNHVSGKRSGVARIYQRHSYATEKREALDKWADFVTSLKVPDHD